MRHLLPVLICALLLAMLPSPAQAANFSVNNAAQLAAAIIAANGTPQVDVISLTGNIALNAVDNVTNGPNGLPPITTPIIILGNGFEIARANGVPQFRVLYVAGGGFFGNGDLTLDNITITNGDINIGTICFTSVDQCGGGLLNYFGLVTIRNSSRFVNNTAYGGGAVYNAGGEINITDSVFTGNTATYGGALYNTGGLIGNPATVIIQTSTYTSNVAVNSGGAIHNQAELFVYDSIFTANQVTGTPLFGGGGGAIHNNSINGQVEIATSSFTTNVAIRGGAISNYNASDIIIYNSLLSNNSNNNNGDGGAIWSDNNAYLEIHSSQIVNNQTGGGFGSGGGIFAGSGLNSELVLVNSTVSNNVANNDGGGIYMNSGNPAVVSNIISSTIAGNMAGGDGGGIYKYSISPLNIIGSVISGNSVPSSNGNGGGIFFDNPTSNVHTHTITDTTISGNQAGEGGGVYSDAFTGTITITNSTIANNTVITTGAVGEGGAGVSNQHGNIDIINSTISGNRVENNTGALSGSGAAIHHGNGGVVTINYSTLANNASRDGGGIRAQSTVTLANSILMNTAVNGPNCNPVLTITDGGNNFVDDGTNCPAGFTVSGVINLGALADNGGPTQTHALLAGSVAIDATGACGLNDQRGIGRDATCDSGAYEAVAAIPPLVTFDSAASSIDEIPGGNVAVNVTLDNTAGNITAGTVSINIAITGTAAQGDDFLLNTGLPLSFAGGSWPAPGSSVTQTVNLDVQADFRVEGDETIVLTLADTGIIGPAELGSITQHTVTILDGISELAVTKTVALTGDANSDGLFDPGDLVTYTITVTNDGPEDAVDVTVEDLLDATRLDLASAIITPSIGMYDPATNEWSQDGAGAGNGFNLAASASATLTIEVPIQAGTEGQTVSNTAAISQAVPPGAADPTRSDDQASVNFIVGTAIITTDPPEPPDITVFDPAISKLGFLLPGQEGAQAEQLEWVVTVTNTGMVTGNNVTITDILDSRLQIDSVDAPGAAVSIGGQTVTVIYPVLDVGETAQFSIYTTVLDGVVVFNTACVNADNQGPEECATGSSISRLPSTGETPVLRN